MATKDRDNALLDDTDGRADNNAATDPPKKRRRPKLAPVAPLPVERDDDDDDGDDRDDRNDDEPARVVVGSLPPKLVIAEPLKARSGHDDDDDDDDDDDEASEAPVTVSPKRARRRPRVEHISTPPKIADEDGDDDGNPDTSPEQPAAKQKPKAAAKKKKSAKQALADRFTHLPFEITGIIVFALGVLVLLSLLSFSSSDTVAGHRGAVHNWIGPGGAVLADLLTLLFGVAAFAVPLAFFAAAVACFRPVKQPRHAALRAAGAVAAVLASMTLLHLAFRQSSSLPFPAGGLTGALIADALARIIAPLGTGVVAVAVCFVGSLIALD